MRWRRRGVGYSHSHHVLHLFPPISNGKLSSLELLRESFLFLGVDESGVLAKNDEDKTGQFQAEQVSRLFRGAGREKENENERDAKESSHVFHESLHISSTEQLGDERLRREPLEIVQVLSGTEEDDGCLGGRDAVYAKKSERAKVSSSRVERTRSSRKDAEMGLTQR